ncbi:hypothetical protein [Pseudooceanicola aestuarii]|uniref:hypothetical protein n=1 Tax=Pseudooceanicola aestuarii TaxID=2697319 RepID=UPI0013CF6730|nr:hypothetical protein [Pseudooceanicola aestuarii]
MADDGMDPVSAGSGLPVVLPRLSRRERDYILLDIYVRMQHGRYEEARRLIDGLLALDQETPDILLARAIVQAMLGEDEAVLDTIRHLERIDPAEIVSGRAPGEKVRVRSFLKARAKFALTGALDEDARAALDFYMRQGGRRAARAVARKGRSG